MDIWKSWHRDFRWFSELKIPSNVDTTPPVSGSGNSKLFSRVVEQYANLEMISISKKYKISCQDSNLEICHIEAVCNRIQRILISSRFVHRECHESQIWISGSTEIFNLFEMDIFFLSIGDRVDLTRPTFDGMEQRTQERKFSSLKSLNS